MSISELQQELKELKELQSEHQKRLRAKNDLLTYVSIIDIPSKPRSGSDEELEKFEPIPKAFGKHHLLWLDCLQKVEDGKIKRLMGLMPPGAGKSVFTSVAFPTHFLGRFPESMVIVTGYGSDLPRKHGRRARSVVKQPLYKRIFGTELSADSAAVDEWTLTNGSEWMAAGILSGITGNRADGVVWDDLIKGMEQADSKTVRDKIWDAYLNDLMTRKKPNGWEIGINTRWNEDDPPGRILPLNFNGETGWVKGQDGNDWYIVCLPAEAEREDDPLGRQLGERLWPEWFTKEHFAPFKMQARTWSALFQQRPAPETGSFFEEQWIKLYGEGTNTSVPDRDTMYVYGASDYATTEKGGDYTVHVVVGVDPYHDIYVLDLWRYRTSPDKWAESLCNLAEQWRPMGWAEERGQITAAVGPFLQRELLDRHLYIPRKGFPTKGDKSIRAQSIRGRMSQGKVYFPRDKSWFPDLRHELLSFPAGKNDDIVDALGLIGQILDVAIRGAPKEKGKEKNKVFSMNPDECTVTLEDLFVDNESKGERSRNLRIA